MIINSSDFGRRQMPMTKIAMSEIPESDERKMVWSQAEIEIQTDSSAVESPPKSYVKNRMRRDRRPTAIIS